MWQKSACRSVNKLSIRSLRCIALRVEWPTMSCSYHRIDRSRKDFGMVRDTECTLLAITKPLSLTVPVSMPISWQCSYPFHVFTPHHDWCPVRPCGQHVPSYPQFPHQFPPNICSSIYHSPLSTLRLFLPILPAKLPYSFLVIAQIHPTSTVHPYLRQLRYSHIYRTQTNIERS